MGKLDRASLGAFSPPHSTLLKSSKSLRNLEGMVGGGFKRKTETNVEPLKVGLGNIITPFVCLSAW